jgi:hypothetical protein
MRKIERVFIFPPSRPTEVRPLFNFLKGGKERGDFALLLEGVLFPTLPPYRSDTSISFFLRGGGGR